MDSVENHLGEIMTTMRRRVTRRGYQFTGRNAERDMHIYELYRLGARLDHLALACGLTEIRLRQIIATANAGSSRSVYVDTLRKRRRVTL
jgi:hypothetical protein